MTEQELWWLALGLFAVVVVVVAVLLGWVIAAAKEIDRRAEDIWTVGKEIAGNTVSIWMLESTNANLERIEKAVGSLDSSVRSLNERLSAGGGEAGGRGAP